MMLPASPPLCQQSLSPRKGHTNHPLLSSRAQGKTHESANTGQAFRCGTGPPAKGQERTLQVIHSSHTHPAEPLYKCSSVNTKSRFELLLHFCELVKKIRTHVFSSLFIIWKEQATGPEHFLLVLQSYRDLTRKQWH